MKGFYWVFGRPHVRLAILQKWLYSESIGSYDSSLMEGSMASLSFGKKSLYGGQSVGEGTQWDVG